MSDALSAGELIYRARVKKGLTQADVADALEVSRVAVSNWERGQSRPESSDRIEALAQLVGLDGKLLRDQMSAEAEATYKEPRRLGPKIRGVRERAPAHSFVVIPSKAYALIEGYVTKLEKAGVGADTIAAAQRIMRGEMGTVLADERRRRSEAEWIEVIEIAWRLLKVVLKQNGFRL